jgi:hypothetical protein
MSLNRRRNAIVEVWTELWARPECALRVADRYTYLDLGRLEALIKSLQLSRTQIKRELRDRAREARSAGR